MKRVMNTLLTLCMILCLCGCSETKRTRVAYTVYPIGYIISRLAGSDVPYQSIQKNDFAMIQNAVIDPEYESRLARASVLFHIGSLEPYYGAFEASIEATGVTVVDLSKGNAVYDYGRYETVEDSEGNTTYVTLPYYENMAFDHIDVLKKDLYLWLDPIAMLSMAKEIRDWLIRKYPISRTFYENNYTALENDLIALDAQYQSIVSAGSDDLAIVTMSQSFGCWQKAYGIDIYPVVQSVYGVLPDEEQIQVIEDTIRNNGVKYIAFESNMSEEMTSLFYRIQSDCDLTRVELSNISSLSENEENEGKDYLSLMYQNLSVLKNLIQSVKADMEGNQ
ncbi:MAG: metal ABC transporter solute-binding protein, Zn/Mn family [Bulleidia sp.]